MKKNILLCVAGGTPQVITETLWALLNDGEIIDEIRVITTLDGRDKIMTGFIKGHGSKEESLLDPKSGKFFQFQRDYPAARDTEFSEKNITLLRTPDGRTLDDIRTREENEFAGDQICEIVREICKNESIRLFASAAGGRKTMSIYLTAAMQLYGRADDLLSHVLVSADFESNPEFFFPPKIPKILKTRDGKKVSTDDAQIHLAPIPFVRLRGIGGEFKRDIKNYAEIVKNAQENLERYDIRIFLADEKIEVGKKSAKLEPVPFFVFVMFAYLRKKNLGNEGFVQINQITLEDIDFVCRMISKAKGEELGFENFDLLRGDAVTRFQI
ncbi:MAG: CRISPR-associated ring nuclease Csm6, partial [Pyrinomonadaceae bacterium]